MRRRFRTSFALGCGSSSERPRDRARTRSACQSRPHPILVKIRIMRPSFENRRRGRLTPNSAVPDCAEGEWVEGYLEEGMALAILRKLCARCASGLFRIEGSLGVGMLWLRDGTIIDARVGSVAGMTAALCMVSADEGSYCVQLGEVRRSRAITQPTHQLIASSSVRLAEWCRCLRAGPPLMSILRVDSQRLQASSREMATCDVGLLTLLEQRRPVLEVLESSGLDPVFAFGRLLALMDAGYATLLASYPPPERAVRSI